MDAMRDVLGGAVLTLAVYPKKGAPGDILREATVIDVGLVGDRPKKRPVHVVGQGIMPETTRANVFLDVPDAALQALVGEQVRLGRVILTITEIPSNCPGVYAEVVRGGVLHVGDTIT